MRSLRGALCVLAAVLAMAALAGCGGSGQATLDQSVGIIAHESAGSGGRDIWIMTGDGTSPDRVVTDARQPCLCGDGLAMAFVKDDNVFTIHPDGTGLFNVTNRPAGQVGTGVSEPAFSPAGDRIAFVIRPVVPDPVPDIQLIDADGTNQTLLVTNGREPAFSPDGSKVVFMRGNDIYMIGTDGSNLQQLTTTGVGVTLASPSFSPSGDEIVYAWAPVVPDPIWNISILDVATKAVTLVVSDGTAPDFSPDGDRIVFVRDGGIFSTDLQGTDVVQLTFGPDDSHPSWE